MPEGGTLSLKTGEGGEWFHIEVRDTGMGISEQDAANIFAPFFTTKASGTGLGLSICDQIVKSHGGSISFTSDENGTVFVVKIPKIIKMED
jgi:signal transduction histidine kinase